ncbi:MAG: D-ribose pyranase [Chloroflexota bacterium]|jgi:D-ribose pyranase|nr:MAG: D-ribose pyranase [Chloroflexota bacterium]
MKKVGTLNQPLSEVIAGLGHMDQLVIGDAGLPIPLETQRIDLALTQGVPSFLETLRVILEEIQVEGAIVAEEMIDVSPDIYKKVKELLPEIPLDSIPHTEFKRQTRGARAVVRTGEFTPYANIILISGVIF